MEGGPLPSGASALWAVGGLSVTASRPHLPLWPRAVFCAHSSGTCPIQVDILGPEEWGKEKPSLEQILIQAKPKSPAHTLTT